MKYLTTALLIACLCGCKETQETSSNTDAKLDALVAEMEKLKTENQALRDRPIVAAASVGSVTAVDHKAESISILKKMQSYTSVGINKINYDEKLLDINADLEANLASVSDADFCAQARDIVVVYKDASTYWATAIEYEDADAYSISFDGYYPLSDDFPDVYNTSQVPKIWLIATKRLAFLEEVEASKLLPPTEADLAFKEILSEGMGRVAGYLREFSASTEKTDKDKALKSALGQTISTKYDVSGMDVAAHLVKKRNDLEVLIDKFLNTQISRGKDPDYDGSFEWQSLVERLTRK